ncbi:MAG TPA: hypothetical protein VMZ02_03250, partial [Candidatus Limnocylindrales bacterium]|nr:hypothetical protein [Candidatus Limnocylindrales bacterium]
MIPAIRSSLRHAAKKLTYVKKDSMGHDSARRIAILYPGDYAERVNATTENSRFVDLFRAFVAEGIHAEPAVYRDDFCSEVHDQLMQV